MAVGWASRARWEEGKTEGKKGPDLSFYTTLNPILPAEKSSPGRTHIFRRVFTGLHKKPPD